MSEQITLPHESMHNIESLELQAVKASELLYTEGDIEAALANAVDTGVVQISPVNSDGSTPDGSRSVYTNVRVEPSEVLDAHGQPFDATSARYSTIYLGPNEFRWATPKGEEKEVDAVLRSVYRRVGSDVAPWYLTDDLLDKKITNGDMIGESYKIEIAGRELDMLNFCADVELDETHKASILDAVQASVNAGGLSVVESISGIAIVSDEELNGTRDGKVIGKALARYQNYNGIIILSDRLFKNDPTLATDKYGIEEAKDRLELTIIHEMGHALQRYQWDTHSDALQWNTKEYENVVDDYGNTKKGRIHSLGKPNDKQQKVIDGKIHNVELEEVLDGFAVNDVKPNTSYGATEAAEDFAESFVAYALAGKHTDKIDPVRANSISVTAFQKIEDSHEYGPFTATMNKIDLRQKKEPFVIGPSHQYVRAGVEIVFFEEKNYKYNKFVDDYGFEQTSRIPTN